MIAVSLPYWPVNPTLSRDPWLFFQFDMMRCVWALMPATLLWGASFPLAIAAVAGRGMIRGAWSGACMRRTLWVRSSAPWASA